MRDMLAAPDQFDWLATRLEIARKPRNDPDFSRGCGAPAELAAATTDRLRRQAGQPSDDVPSDACGATLTWCSTDCWPGWPPAKTREWLAAVLGPWWRTRSVLIALTAI